MSGKRYAILIASSKFPEEPGLTELRCPENDVDALNEILSLPELGGFEEPLVFKNAPSHEIMPQINRILLDADKDDLVLIYFSGHGKRNRPLHLHLATANTRINTLETTSIPAQMLGYLFEHSYSKRKILLLDCCRSGAVGKLFTKGGDDEELLRISEADGTFIMTACAAEQLAQEGQQHSVFTKHLIEGIRSGEADRNEDGWVDIHELYDHVYECVRAEGAQEPMKWDLHAKGSMIIAKSGNALREQRRQEIERSLHRLAADGLLTSRIVQEAANVLRVPKKELTGGKQQHIALIEQLVGSKIGSADFIEQWMDLRCLDCAAAQKASKAEAKQSVSVMQKLAEAVIIAGGAAQTVSTAQKAVNVVLKANAKQELPIVSVEHPAPSLPKQGDIMRDKITGMELVFIPTGCFMMGSEEYADEKPVHEVCVDGFWMGKYPVTQGQWQKLMGKNPSHFQKGDKHPVEQVSWDDAQDFIKKLNSQSGKTFRLPTEAEWEYACRAGSSGSHYDDDLDAIAWYEKNSGGSTHPVGEKEANAFGLHDTLGNV